MKNYQKRKANSLELQSPLPTASCPLPTGPHSGLTLVELLVVIVILVTLVGGVLPVLSPNNDARNIESASRGLKTYFQRAQTRAVRTGRPVGVAFRESSLESGVALEVYQVEIPRAYSGFSSESTAKFYDPNPTDNTYTYIIDFGEGFGSNFVLATEPVIPPRMVRVGDIIQIGNSHFKLERGRNRIDTALRQETGEVFFEPTNRFTYAELVSGPAPPTVPVNLDDFKPVGPPAPPGTKTFLSYPRNYAVDRQPVPTSEPPYVLPKGVAIDMHASGIEGGANPTMLAANNVINNEKQLKQLSLMFSPAGGVDSIYYNGLRMGEKQFENGYPSNNLSQRITDASRFVLLLAQVELGGTQIARDPDNDGQQIEDVWSLNPDDSDERLAEVREEVSWLNLDSRWMVVDGRNGKTRVIQNSAVDPRDPRFKNYRGSESEFAFQQIMDARSGGDAAAIDQQSSF